MRDWYFAPEIAGLPGLPRTERRVRAKAAREGWECRERENGKGREYHITALPEGAFMALRRQDKESNAQTSRADTCGAAVKEKLIEPAPAHEARREILAAYASQRERYRLPPRAFAVQFMRAYNANDPAIVVSASTRAAMPTLAERTLRRWLRHAARGHQPQHGGKRTPALIEPGTDLYTFIVGCIAGKPHIDAAQVTAGMRARFASDAAGQTLPSERSVRRFMSRYRRENAPALLASANPDAYRSKHLPAFGDAAAGVAGLNAQWQADATIGDIEIITPDGRRWAIVGIVDVWSRRGLLHLTPSVSSAAYGAAYRKALLAWGVPQEIVTDRGSAETSLYIRAALDALGIAHHGCRPYHPEEKGFIERFLGTASHQCLEILPGYVGHSVADRQAIRSRKAWGARFGDGPRLVEATMTSEALQAHLDAWCANIYGQAIHSNIGTSPILKAAEWTRPVRMISDVRALDALLAPLAGTRRVLKKGIRIAGGWFIAPDLGCHMGAEVIIRHDPVDMGRVAVYLAATREFIAEAVCAERAGADRQAIAVEARRRHAAAVAQSRAHFRAAARAAKPERIAEELVASAAAQTVVPLPPRTTQHTTPALEQAGIAARAGEISPPTPLTPAQAALQRRIAANPLGARDRAADEMAAKRARFARAQGLLASQAAGAALDPADARWLQGYRATAEFRAQARMAEDTSLAAAG